MVTYLNPVNRVAGLMSGLDTQQIIEDLMRVARIPLERLEQQRQLLEWKQEDYRAINRALREFRENYASQMRFQGTFQVMTATSSDENVVTATASGSAQPGTYSITVTQLAEVASNISAESLSLDPNDKIDPEATLESQKSKFRVSWGDTTTLEFKITTYDPDGTPHSVTFTVDTTTDSLNDVLARINAETSLGVTAFYEASTDKVVISTNRTGDYSTNEIEIEDVVTGNFALGTLALSRTAQGKNAILSINGLTGIEQHENSFTLNNVTFTLKKTTESPVLITVARDTEAIYETVTSFVEQFNSLLESINSELNEERYPDYLPLTDEQREQLTDTQIEQWEEKARSGLLQNDPILRDVVYKLRRAITTPVSGVEGYDSIYDIGITTGGYWEGGKLYIDEAKLREKINEDPEAVMNLFTRVTDSFLDNGLTAENYSEQGLGVRIYEELNRAIDLITEHAGYPTSYSLYDNSYLGRSLRDIDSRIETMEERLERLEDRYWQQFTALEEALATLQAQSSWLMSQASQMGGSQ